MTKAKSLNKSAGFTLVELAVIAPIVVLVITGILVVLINFISSNAVTSSKLSLTDDTNAALSDMENQLAPAQSFASSVDSGLSLQNTNSADYSSRPKLIGVTTDEVGTGTGATPALKDCNQPISSDNLRPTATIYYLDSSNNLKRRILTQSSTPCGGTSVNPKNCRAFNITSSCADDTTLASNVTSFVVKYCIGSSCTTGNSPADADSVDVSITTEKTVAGKKLSASDNIHVGLLGKVATEEEPEDPPEEPGGTCPGAYTDQSLTGTATGSVWGTDIYTNDSTRGKAAVHAGVLTIGQTATVRVCTLPGQSSYTGSTRNGITTSSYGAWAGSLSFVSAGGGGGGSGFSVSANPDTITMSATYGSYNWPLASTLTMSNGTPPYDYEITPIDGEEDMLGLSVIDQSYAGCIAYQDSNGYEFVGVETDGCYGGLFDSAGSGGAILGVYDQYPGTYAYNDCYNTNLLYQPSAFRVTVTDSASHTASTIVKIYCDYWGYYNYDDDICNWYGSPICTE